MPEWIERMTVVGGFFVVSYMWQGATLVEVFDLSQDNPNGQFCTREPDRAPYYGETMPLRECTFPGAIPIQYLSWGPDMDPVYGPTM